MEVSTDWCVTVEHQRLSSIEVISVNYQTSKLQCNYQSYIQIHVIGNAQGFSGIASITPSGGFSVETLTRVQLCYGKLSWIGVSPSWKIESLDCCITVMWVCCKKGGLLDQILIRSIITEMYFLDRYQVQFILGLKVYKINLEMCELMEQPWLQLMYCTVCLPRGCNFREQEEV